MNMLQMIIMSSFLISEGFESVIEAKLTLTYLNKLTQHEL